MNEYSFPLHRMVGLLETHRSSGTLRTFLERGIRGVTREPIQVFLQIERGKVAQATILLLNTQEVLLQGRAALEALSRVKELDWTFIPAQKPGATTLFTPTQAPDIPESSPSSPEQAFPIFPAASRSPAYPRRARALSQEEVQSLDRTHRRIVVVADGTRSFEQIARLLGLPQETVERSLHYLRQRGIIAE